MRRYALNILDDGDDDMIESPTGDYIRHDDPDLAALVKAATEAVRTLHDRDMNASMSAWDHLIAGNTKDAMDQIEEVAECLSNALAAVAGTTRGTT